MTPQIWIAFITYALVIAYTPGPNNIISLNTTTKYGFKKSNSLRLGIGVGFTIVMMITNSLAFALGEWLPGIIVYFKYAGAAYILFLAYKVARSKPNNSSEAKIPRFFTGFFLQFVNIKIILYGFTAVTVFFLPYYTEFRDLIWFFLILVVNAQIAIWIWGGLGFAFRTFINRHYIVFNIIMALILVESAVSILLQQ